MKKAFCFSLIVMFFALAGLTPVKADDIAVVTPYVDTPTLSQAELDQYTYSTMLMEYLRCGGTIDVKNKSDNFSSYDLIEDFGNFVEDIIGVVSDVINPFQSEFQWGKGYPLNKATPATLQFMGLLPFYALSPTEEPTPTPTPDENYISYINMINGDLGGGFDFFWKDYPDFTIINTYPFTLLTFPWSNYSYFCSSMTFNTSAFNTNRIYASDIIDINIISSNDTYTFNLSVSPETIGLITDTNPATNCTGIKFTVSGNQPQIRLDLVNTYPVQTFTYTGSLNEIFQYLQNHFRNVNIYVDGVLWAYVGGTATSYNIELSTSTVTPAGERVRWMYDKEIYVDMDKIVEKLDDILDAIDNTPNTPTIIKFDDLQDVIVDVDGQPAIAVKVLVDSRNIDKIYLDTYGPIIPAFLPLFTPVIDDVDIIAIADTAVSPIPSDLLEVFGYMFMGVLFVGFIHRLLE